MHEIMKTIKAYKNKEFPSRIFVLFFRIIETEKWVLVILSINKVGGGLLGMNAQWDIRNPETINEMLLRRVVQLLIINTLLR